MYTQDNLIDNIRELEEQVTSLQSQVDEMIDPDDCDYIHRDDISDYIYELGDWIHVDSIDEHISDTGDWIHTEDIDEYVSERGDWIRVDEAAEYAIENEDAAPISYVEDFERLQSSLTDLFDMIGETNLTCCASCVEEVLSDQTSSVAEALYGVYELYHSLDNV